MRYGKGNCQRRVMVEITYREHYLGPLKRDVYWVRVLPVAVYTSMLSKLGRVLDEAEAMCPESWGAQFNSAPVGKRRKIMR